MSSSRVKQALAPDDAPEHKKLDRGLLARLWGYLRPYRRWVWASLAISLAMTALKVAQPWLVQRIIDTKIATRDVPGVMRMTALLLAIILAAGAAEAAFDYIATWSGQQAMHDLRRELIRRILRQDTAFFDRNPIGRLITRLTSDVDTLSEMLSTGMVSVLGELLVIVGVVGVMLHFSVTLTGVVLLGAPAILLVVTLFRKHARRWYLETRRSLATMNAYLQENIGGIRTVQAYGREARNLGQFAALNDDYRTANLNTIFAFALFFPAMNILLALVVTGVIWIGGRAIIEERLLGGEALTFGKLFLFVQCTEMLFSPIRTLSERYNLLQSAMASSERIFALIDGEPKIQSPANGKAAPTLRRAIRLEDVHFEYLPGQPVLKGVSFAIPRGQTVAVVGATGAGKSTLINLLARFYDVTAGRITIDGIDVREWELEALRRLYAVVLQDVFLFSGTVGENLRIGNPELSDERLWSILRDVKADFVHELAGGLSAPVSERGGTFSTGQKQLLAFARALATDPQVLILDEATANIDTETERHIQAAIARLLEGRTALVIAHRLSTIQRADNILVMHHGQIHEQGTHEELIARDGLYRRLYELQYRGEAVTG
jgi:ATP-binding cassette subfamily B protein